MKPMINITCIFYLQGSLKVVEAGFSGSKMSRFSCLRKVLVLV